MERNESNKSLKKQEINPKERDFIIENLPDLFKQLFMLTAGASYYLLTEFKEGSGEAFTTLKTYFDFLLKLISYFQGDINTILYNKSKK